MDNKDLENVTNNSDIVDPGYQPNQTNYDSTDNQSFYNNSTPTFSRENNTNRSFDYHSQHSFQTNEKSELFSNISLITSIIGLLLFCCNATLGFLLAIAAIVFGILSKKKTNYNTPNATIGILIGIVALALNIVAIVFHSVVSTIFHFIF